MPSINLKDIDLDDLDELEELDENEEFIGGKEKIKKGKKFDDGTKPTKCSKKRGKNYLKKDNNDEI